VALKEYGKSSHMPTIIVGASGVGELLANTLAVRNVNVVVLDVNPIVTENCV
jgi:Trk K+ transport system NAD-binding subunit